jgi:RHS repeat-associated protein
MDGIGHPIHSQLNSDPVSTVYVDTTYDGEGNVATVSNPYRFTSDPTYGVTTYTHDALNRVTLKTNPGDNSTESWSYSGNGTTFKDEDGNSWTRTYDSFGRLTNVIEPTGETTGSYAYNALDDLTGATHGTQPRSFSYDSLSRLTSAFNPETGTISYSYDNNGNILTKRDARGITTTYCPYDALNRVICKSYSDGTPTVSYAYDKPDAAIASYAFGNFKGRLGGAYLSQSGVPLENYLPEGYDAMGRPYGYVECPGTSSCVANNNGNAVIASGVFYDLAGDAMANSAGVVHTIAATTAGDFAAAALSTYDTAEHLNSIVGETETFTAPGQGNPSTMSLFSATSTNPSAPAYGPMGLMNVQLPSNSTTQPTPINISRTYDKRGRILTETDLGGSAQSPIYQYALGYDPVGNVTSFNDFVMGNWTAGYSVNRLISSSASVGIYSNINFGWTYDSLGNRLTQTPSGSGQTPVPTAQTLTYNGNNQINGLVYDAAGNLTDDGTSKYLYDGEGRLCAVYHYQVPISQTQYIYDAMGRRVGKGSISSFSCNVLTNGFSLSNEYVYGLDGKQLVETSGWFAVLHSNFFANGQLLATNNGANWYYNLNDWVGTKRVVANMSGSINVEYASLPYGDGQTTVNYYGSDDTEHHFTGKERDPESGNDYFGARYYSSNMGRWMSPDPKAPSAKTLMNPQKWNKYNYVLNNPLSMFDPDGLVEMTVQLRAYIPQGHVFMYRGDNRGPTASQASNVTSRTSITLRIETDPSKSSTGVLSNPGGQAGTTHNDLTGNFGTQTVGVPKAQVGRDGNGNVVITIKQDAANPLTPQGETPGIKSDLTVSIPVDGSSVTTSGTLSGAPAFELNVGTPGNSMTNIPLQGASSNSFLFLNDLRQTNKLPTTTTPLPAPCQGSNCHQ